MNAFELLFIFLFLVSLVTFATVGVLLLSRRRDAALRIIRRYSICLAAYLAIVLVSSLLASREQLTIDEPLCFDDWCISVESVEAKEAQEYVVAMKLFSRARRAPQRETGLVLYLTDSSKERYASVLTEGDIPFDIRLLPNESVEVSRRFKLPSGSTPMGVVVAHEGGFPITWFIIGDGPFKKAPIVMLSHRTRS